jgi:hypothetical protein
MVTGFRRWLAIKRYRWAFFWHAVNQPPLSENISRGELRRQTILLLGSRWDAKGPKPEDYGLRPEDVRKGNASWLA